MGLIASWFIEDLYNGSKRESRPVSHVIAAVASRSEARAAEALGKISPTLKPTILTSYEALAKSQDVDAII